MNPKALREQAKKVHNQRIALAQKVEAEDRDFTEDEESLYNDLGAEHERLINRAKRLEELEGISNEYGTPQSQNQTRQTQPVGDNSIPATPRNAENDAMRGFRNQREFLTSVMDAHQTGRVDDRLRPLQVRNAAGSDEHNTLSDPYGGFLVPEGMLPGYMRTEPEPDPIMGRLTNVPMQTSVVSVNARVDKNHSTSVSGGLTVTRRVETQPGASSRMQFEQIRLEAHSLYGLSYASEELIADSPQTIAAIISQGFRDEFQSKLIEERLRGTGVGEFLGILNSPATISVAKENSQTADTITAANVIKMRKRAWRYNTAIWMANIDTYDQLATLNIAGTNSDVFLFNPARGIDVPDTLLGRPIVFTEYASTLGDHGDLILATWSEYLEGTYQPLQGAESIHVRFLENERAFRFTMRNAGAPWWRSPLTPKNGANTLSPFVTLAERA